MLSLFLNVNKRSFLVFVDYYRDRLKADHSVGLFFEATSSIYAQNTRVPKTNLYPYRMIHLETVFVYGEDFRRERDVFVISVSVLIQGASIILFMVLAANSLIIIRRKFNIQPNDYSSAFIEIITLFIGGGSVRIQHKYEKWFFTVLSFGAFLIMCVIAGDLLDNFIKVLDTKISKFEELVDINPPIYIHSLILGLHVYTIEAFIQ